MIWTEEEQSVRSINTMLEPKGKSCSNCNWGEGLVKQQDQSDWTTCGHHHENFKIDSLCAYWTDPNDQTLKLHNQKRSDELLKKLKSRKRGA